MSQSNNPSTASTFPWKELLTFLGVILAAYFGYLGIRSQIEIPIQATQTAEAKLTLAAQTLVSDNATSLPVQLLITATSTQPPSGTTSNISYTMPNQDDLAVYPNLMEGTFYKNPQIPSISNYQVNVSTGISYIWGYTWCAQDGNVLSNNLSLIKLNFLIEDSEIPDESFYKYKTSKSGWECRGWSVLLNNWTGIDKIKVTVLYTISGKLFDGKYSYEPGQYRHDILITVQQ